MQEGKKIQDGESNSMRSRNLEVDRNHPGLCDSGSGDAVQPNTSECAGLKFNDFNKLREDAKFSECQA
ncbi:unnamed protein product [Eruca vesicaria subsp. sativa]|uniref:Uncharacterized protein n=1 Tax=Eruca vesicaria subsp. sativa TaxID=29727 RepID=A0ABC8LDA4_ERUVS|nr:unnamed protein product [Eruca vesicaria subsp. sativa]